MRAGVVVGTPAVWRLRGEEDEVELARVDIFFIAEKLVVDERRPQGKREAAAAVSTSRIA